MSQRDLIGYGRFTPRVVWPNQARIVINLVVNYEEGAEYTVVDGDARQEGFTEYNSEPMNPRYRDFAAESIYEYGSRAGIWRLARLFDKYDIPVTISACAVALQKNPEVVEWIKTSRHDVMAHGWRWSEMWLLTRDEEQQHIRQTVHELTKMLGERPLGWNSRYGPSENTRELLVEEGFLYDSDAYNDDLPYFAQVSRHRHLVIPYTKLYNDTRFILAQGYSAPGDFLETCRKALDYLCEEGQISPKMMSIGVHARIAGQAARTSALEDFIKYAIKKDGVLFLRRRDIAHWWIGHYQEFSR